MKIIIIGGLTNGKILIDYFLKKKNIKINLLITHPYNKKIPRITNLNYLKKYNFEVIFDLNANKYSKKIKRLKPDIIFVIGWSGMINQSIIKNAKIGVIGFHPSKLPHYRGRSVIAWQIEEEVKKSAYTAFFINNKPDAGDILVQKTFLIKRKDYVKDILDKVDDALKKMLPRIYNMINRNSFTRIKQDLNKGFYKKLRTDENSLINWNSSSRDIYNKIRAVSEPYPGAFFYKNKKKYIINKSEILKKLKVKKKNYYSGEFYNFSKNFAIIQSKDYPIKVYFKKK